MDKLEINFGEGTEYERILVIERPKGKKARKMSQKIVQFLTRVEGVNFEDIDSFVDVSKLINSFWDEDEFEDVYVPYVLGLDTQEDRQYLEDNGTLGEVFQAFVEAAGWIVQNSFAGEEVNEALGKSEEEPEEVVVVK